PYASAVRTPRAPPPFPSTTLFRPDPAATLRLAGPRRHPRIPLPEAMLPDRRNSAGQDFADAERLIGLAETMAEAGSQPRTGGPLVCGRAVHGVARSVRDPADRHRCLGEVVDAGAEEVERALAAAHAASGDWERTPVAERAVILERI